MSWRCALALTRRRTTRIEAIAAATPGAVRRLGNRGAAGATASSREIALNGFPCRTGALSPCPVRAGNGCGRWRIALAAAIVAPWALADSADAGTPSFYEQRLIYQRAVHAIRHGRVTAFRREQARLRDYPLRVYLDYYDAERRISSLSAKQAKEIAAKLAATPLAPMFSRRWLQAQARRGRWDVYLANYEPTADAAGRCNYLRALYRSGARDEALDQARELWISPRSQPKTCDPLFEAWIGAGRLDQEAVWARLELALDADEVTLARYVLRFFDVANVSAGRQYYDVHVRPRMTRSLSRFEDNDGGRRALRHGLLRHARRHPKEALALWERAARQRDFNAADRRFITERLATAAAEAGVPPTEGPEGFLPDNVERVALAMVRQREWARAAKWIAALPAAVGDMPRWQYWLGQALARDGKEAAGRAALNTVAAARNYYGFMAAEELGLAPRLNAVSPRYDAIAQAALLKMPAVRRLTELYAVGDLVNARREWEHVLPRLDEEAKRDLVEWAANVGWSARAIFGARDGEMADLVAIRFPRPYLDTFRRYAFQTELSIHFLLAIARQESAFNPDAVSSAGARGLMQLMPGTARHVADRLRVKRPARDDLTDPEVNVRLAANHLAYLMRRYGGSRVLAAAAYNAGERRVNAWLKDADGMPASVWVERIPFRETRDYVKGVIAFAQVYAQLAQETAPVLAAHERAIRRP